MTDIQHLSIGETFYYHSDHLGSAAYLTLHGQVYQTLNYLPYGEDWVDIQNYAKTRYPRLGIYTYNGKDPRKGWRIQLDEIKYNEQKDYESGFHYYGARYYWSEVLTGWLSVDPMMDKYPEVSPYAYCAWNPVKLVDPDGQEDWEVDKLGHITKCQEQPENPTEDRIRVKGTSGWDEKNSISGLTRGTITEQQREKLSNASTEYGSLMIMGGTQKDRIDVFKFCADHADVEFSLMEFDLGNGRKHQSILTTSHDVRAVGKEKIGDGLGSAIAEKYFSTLQLHIHNHFGSGQYGWGASYADYDFRDAILDKQKYNKENCPNADLYPSARFGIYKCRGNDKQIIYY